VTIADPRDVVALKRDAAELPPGALADLLLAHSRGEVPDELAAAFLMAAFVNGLSPRETAELTRAMIDSGVTLPLAGVSRPKVDKHSTGGVSDGVTLVFAPLAASLGLAVAKLSGRGLGHTGGTLDKLESIPGLRTDLSPAELERQVEAIGCAVAGQSKDLVPEDGKLYALREATATIPSVPLIAASVMSKKLAVGSDLILLDVKTGSGAFMKTPAAAAALARACVALADDWGRPARAAVTDMSQPLGHAVGNAIEVAEAVRLLRGEEHGRLRELAVTFAAEALVTLEGRDRDDARKAAEGALDEGGAADCFARMVEAQGGDPSVVEAPWDVLPSAPVHQVVPGPGGHLVATDAEALGRVAVGLGAGRLRKGAPVDPAVGFEFLPSIGDRVEPGAPVAVVHARDPEGAALAGRGILEASTFAETASQSPPLVYGWHGVEGS
jgi:pyrimidine-nucleoside phosphorylase